jgi:predicted site-specific integrase-resolvase
MMTVREVATRDGVTLKTVYDRLWAGRIPGVKKINEVWRIPVEESEPTVSRFVTSE